MSGEVKHQWNGSVLTIMSDSGASSADLQGPKGDTGPRGPQGPAGVIYDEEGKIILDMSDYYSKTEVDDMMAGVVFEGNLETYATKNYVNAKITYGTENLVAGSSTLAPGALYVVYEE